MLTKYIIVTVAGVVAIFGTYDVHKRVRQVARGYWSGLTVTPKYSIVVGCMALVASSLLFFLSYPHLDAYWALPIRIVMACGIVQLGIAIGYLIRHVLASGQAPDRQPRGPLGWIVFFAHFGILITLVVYGVVRLVGILSA